MTDWQSGDTGHIKAHNALGVRFPPELLVGNPTNPGAALSTFLSASSGKRIVFPRGITFTLEQKITVDALTYANIDFNGCTFAMPDNCSWAGTRVALNFTNCTNLTLQNFYTDGNRAGNAEDNSIFGILVKDSSSIIIDNTSYKNFSHHAIWVSTNTQHVSFTNTQLYNNYGVTTSADVYIDNLTGDNLSFQNTIIERDELGGNQAFYVNGYNTTIEGVRAKNIKNKVLDYRKGIHYARDIVAENCEMIVGIVGSDANDLPEITVTNVVGIDVNPILWSQAIYITGCKRAWLTDIYIQFKSDCVNRWYGIRVNRAGDADTVKDVKVRNLRVINEKIATIFFQSLDNSCYFENVSCEPNVETSYQVYVENTVTTAQYVSKIISNTTSRTFMDANNIIILDGIRQGTTAQRPVGVAVGTMYYDQTLGKALWWNNENWVNAAGEAVE